MTAIYNHMIRLHGQPSWILLQTSHNDHHNFNADYYNIDVHVHFIYIGKSKFSFIVYIYALVKED